MKPLPYRARRVDTNKEVFGDKFTAEGRVFIVSPDCEIMGVGLCGDICITDFVEVHPSTVSQSTGRKDKHEQDIYGGDKIRPWEDDIILVVTWNDEGAYWGTIDWEGKEYVRLGVLDLRKVYEIIPEGDKT